MARRTRLATTANPVADAIARAGATASSVSAATGIPEATLSTPMEMTVEQLGKVGGFLHVRPSELIGEAA
jgi:hypothetical protein